MIEEIETIQGSMLSCSTKTLLTCALLFGYKTINTTKAGQFGMHSEDFGEAFSEIRPSFNERHKFHHLLTQFVEGVDMGSRTIIMKERADDEDEGA